MRALDKFKRDLTKHRGKAAVLGILFVTMVVVGVRAVMQLRPREAAAGLIPAAGSLSHTKQTQENGTQAAARIKQSKVLWSTLRQVKATALNSQATFTFDASYYPPPAVTAEVKTATNTTPAVVLTAIPAPVMEDAATKTRRIREQARMLVVKSTAVGNGTTEPLAIINQQLLTVGQKIMGFEITAIRAREVEFLKEGVTSVSKMPDGQ